jgi:hypothetical protein
MFTAGTNSTTVIIQHCSVNDTMGMIHMGAIQHCKYNTNPYMLYTGLTILWWYSNTAYVLNGFIPISLMVMVFAVTGTVMEIYTHSIPLNNPRYVILGLTWFVQHHSRETLPGLVEEAMLVHCCVYVDEPVCQYVLLRSKGLNGATCTI